MITNSFPTSTKKMRTWSKISTSCTTSHHYIFGKHLLLLLLLRTSNKCRANVCRWPQEPALFSVCVAVTACMYMSNSREQSRRTKDWSEKKRGKRSIHHPSVATPGEEITFFMLSLPKSLLCKGGGDQTPGGKQRRLYGMPHTRYYVLFMYT